MTSVAQYDKDITKEIDSKLISHGSLNCRLSPFTKGKSHAIISELQTSRELSQIHIE